MNTKERVSFASAMRQVYFILAVLAVLTLVGIGALIWWLV